jgi:hypothetical protein
MNHDSFNSNNSNQFTISYELLSLLRWLIEHDADKLKKIVQKAVASGLKKDIKRLEGGDAAQAELIEEVQHSIIEFFSLMESLLLIVLSEDATQKASEQKLIPALDHIDTTTYDTATLRSSVAQATHVVENNPKENAQDILFKEMIKRWKPNKKQIMH